MTDIPHLEGLADSARAVRSRRRASLLLPYVCVFAAGAAGLLLGRSLGGDTSAIEPKLVLLLRFMAVVKFAGVLGAAVALHWRTTYPITTRLEWAYLAALTTMAVAPGLIYSLGAIAMGALLFHIGLLTFLAIAWKDDKTHLLARRR